MKYILICIGDYNNQKDVIQKIANEIMPTVSSKTVKYYNNDLNIIFHFESQVEFETLKVLIDDAVTPFVGMYILSACTQTMSLGMPEELYGYLFNLDDENTPPPSINSIEVVQGEITIDEEFLNSVKEIHEDILSEMEEMGLMDECDDDLARIVRKSKKMDEVPTLDNLLDKIGTKGIGSLTKEEKELLEQYSK